MHRRVTCLHCGKQRRPATWGRMQSSRAGVMEPAHPRSREIHQDDSPCAVTTVGSSPKQNEITVTGKRERPSEEAGCQPHV